MTHDDMLKLKAEEALSTNMHNSSLGINIQVEKGYITLTGIVDVLAEKSAAQEIISRLSGIKGVNNELTVGMDNYVEDEEITEQVIQRFLEEPQIEAKEIGAVAKKGVVYLKGHAKTLAEVEIAKELAGTVMGVKDVVNQLKIGQHLEGPHDDATLTNAVEVALSASGEVSARDVKTRCENGVIYLEGTVDNPAQRQAAQRWATTVPGVRRVVNKLRGVRLVQ